MNKMKILSKLIIIFLFFQSFSSAETSQQVDKISKNLRCLICQGQSVNLFFPAGAQKRYVNRTHIKAWCRGLKGLYYLRTEAKQRAETVAEGVERHVLAEDKRTIVYGKDDCPYCMAVKEELNLIRKIL